jgi:hypothetical protein
MYMLYDRPDEGVRKYASCITIIMMPRTSTCTHTGIVYMQETAYTMEILYCYYMKIYESLTEGT